MSYDIILAGLGAVGSSTAFHLSQRGLRVLGLDRFRPPHKQGSTHGGSRVIRETAFEHPLYVPLARRAYENWRRLEAATGESLLRVTGVLYVGPPGETLVAGTLTSARLHGIRHETLDATALAQRYPDFSAVGEAIGVFEPGAGWIDPERSVAAALPFAMDHGVELRFEEPLLRWEAAGRGVRVTTAGGQYEAGKLLLAAGPWMPGMLGADCAGLSVERQVQHWFAPAPGAALGRLPVFIRQTAEAVFYALPTAATADGAVKVAVHHDGAPTTPATVQRVVGEEEIAHTKSLSRGTCRRWPGSTVRAPSACTRTARTANSSSTATRRTPPWSSPVPVRGSGSSSPAWWVRFSPGCCWTRPLRST